MWYAAHIPFTHNPTVHILFQFQLLSHPASVIRGVTLDLVNYLNQVQKEHLSSEEARLVFSGRIGSGKSYVLYQAVEWCLTTGWIVLYIPRGAYSLAYTRQCFSNLMHIRLCSRKFRKFIYSLYVWPPHANIFPT